MGFRPQQRFSARSGSQEAPIPDALSSVSPRQHDSFLQGRPVEPSILNPHALLISPSLHPLEPCSGQAPTIAESGESAPDRRWHCGHSHHKVLGMTLQYESLHLKLKKCSSVHSAVPFSFPCHPIPQVQKSSFPYSMFHLLFHFILRFSNISLRTASSLRPKP